MKYRVFAMLLLILLCIPPKLIDAQTSEAPPYLFYYSQLLGGLIIERADGTDSRHIAADVIPPDLTGISGPGWSPSGKYFAAVGTSIYLIDSQGNSRVDGLDRMGSVSLMLWSPTGEDLLLIVGNLDDRDGGPNGMNNFDPAKFFWLIDVEKGQLLTDFSADFDTPTYSLSEILWDMANRQISFYVSHDSIYPTRYYHVTMQFDGTTLREPTDEAEFVPMSSGMEIDDSFDLYDGNADSPSGRYQARGTHPTTLTNLLTNTVVTLPMHSQGTICRDYLWSEDEHYLIALTGTLVSGGGCYTPVIGVTDDHGTLWRELGGCDWAEGTCMGWLPSQVDLRSLPAGTAEPVQLDPIRIEYEADLGYRLLSAPTDFRLICESDGSATIIDIESEETLFRLNDVECPYASYDVLPDVGLPIILAYDPVNELLATYAQDWETGVLIWQRQKNGNGYWNRVYQLNSQGYALEFSEDGSELRAGNFSGWKTFAVDAILERIQRSDSTD